MGAWIARAGGSDEAGFAAVLAHLARGPLPLDDEVFRDMAAHLVLNPDQAHALLAAQADWPEEAPRILRFRRLEGDAVIDVDVPGHLWFDGEVDGDVTFGGRSVEGLFVDGTIAGSLCFRGETGGIWSRAEVEGRLEIPAQVHGNVWVGGTIGDGITIEGGEVEGRLQLACETGGRVEIDSPLGSATLGGDPISWLSLHGPVTGDVAIGGGFWSVELGGPIGGDLTVEANATELILGASTGGSVSVHGNVEECVLIVGGAGGDVTIDAIVDGALVITNRIAGQLSILGTAHGGLDLQGVEVQNRTTVNPTAPMALVSVEGARFDAPVFIGDGVSLARCDFRRCVGIDQLELVGSDLFVDVPTGDAPPPDSPIAPTQASELLGPVDVTSTARERASIQRQLRMNLEGRGNRPAAAAFYRGEMNARREDAAQRHDWVEWGWISVYKVVAGYGTSVLRPIAAFVVVAAITSSLFGTVWTPTTSGRVAMSSADTVMFAIQSMVSFFRPPEADLSATEEAVQLVARFIGPVLVAQAVLGARERLAR